MLINLSQWHRRMKKLTKAEKGEIVKTLQNEIKEFFKTQVHCFPELKM